MTSDADMMRPRAELACHQMCYVTRYCVSRSKEDQTASMVFAGRLLDSAQYVLWSKSLDPQILFVLRVYSVLGMLVLAAMQWQCKTMQRQVEGCHKDAVCLSSDRLPTMITASQ